MKKIKPSNFPFHLILTGAQFIIQVLTYAEEGKGVLNRMGIKFKKKQKVTLLSYLVVNVGETNIRYELTFKRIALKGQEPFWRCGYQGVSGFLLDEFSELVAVEASSIEEGKKLLNRYLIDNNFIVQ